MERENIIILPAAVNTLIVRSWELSYRLLWSKCILIEEDIQNIKSWIAEYYWSIRPNEFQHCAEEHFEIFCKKIDEISSGTQFSMDLYSFRNMLMTG